jgi:outer membrane protein assembly factor BamB
MTKILTFLVVSLLTLTLACNHAPQAPSDPLSELADDTLAEVETPVLPFPDTMLPSAEKVMVEIDTIDPTLPWEIKDFTDAYADAPGIFTFRGSPTRNPNFCGRLHGDSLFIHTEWEFTTALDNSNSSSHGSWGGGTGWTGQPLYIHWPDSLQELIVASLCGYVYFLDFKTGKPSRPYYDTRNVLKGTPSLNPYLNGDLYVGHGVQKTAPFGHSVYNLFTSEETHAFGKDPKAWRSWGAYDSSPIVVDSFLFRPGENGTLYKYYIGNGQFALQSTLRFSLTNTKRSPGMESSMAVYRNYGYVTDNAGNILCINLNTLQPVWHYHNHDDTDASPLLEIVDEVPYLYTGCEIDKQGTKGFSYFIKLNGLTGERLWEDTIPCRRISFGEKTLDAGMFGSPVLGEGDCSDMIFSTFCMNFTKERGCLAAFDKNDGRLLYKTLLKQYAWSSPVPFYNDDNELFLFVGDCSGYTYVIKGKTGEIVACEKIGSNFESTPIVVDDRVILGSRGNKIFSIALQ